MPRRIFTSSPVLAVLLLTRGAAACPFCDSETAREVRAGIIGGDLTVNVLATLLPFVVTFAVVAAIHFGGRGSRRRGS